MGEALLAVYTVSFLNNWGVPFSFPSVPSTDEPCLKITKAASSRGFSRSSIFRFMIICRKNSCSYFQPGFISCRVYFWTFVVRKDWSLQWRAVFLFACSHCFCLILPSSCWQVVYNNALSLAYDRLLQTPTPHSFQSFLMFLSFFLAAMLKVSKSSMLLCDVFCTIRKEYSNGF